MSKLPKGWKVAELRSLVKFASGGTPSREVARFWNGDIPWLSAKDLKKFRLNDSIEKVTQEGAKSGTRLVEAGNVLILVRGMTLLKDVPVGVTERAVAFNQDLRALIPNGEVDGYYLGFYLAANKTRLMTLVDQAGHGTGRLSSDLLQSFEIELPGLQEQRKIADILLVWDRAIEQTEEIILAKTHIERGLVQLLLSGRKRFVGCENEVWQEAHFGDFLTESRIPGSDGVKAKKITVKLYGKGVIEKTEKLPGSANTKYHIRRAGQFIYSKLDFLNGAFGIIPEQLDGYESTLDLPAFDIDERLDPLWLFYFVSRSHFYERYANAAEGGRKARRVQPDEFLKTKARFPSIEEQRRIAAVLNACDKEITLLKQQLGALRRQKRGLMQKLLTGQIRVRA